MPIGIPPEGPWLELNKQKKTNEYSHETKNPRVWARIQNKTNEYSTVN